MTNAPSAPAGRLGAVDGLRGIAVLAVFLNHTCQWPTGGHLGVDVFFVLSGFLISSQLFAELERSGRVDLAHFYARRCWRLLPAFGLMCLLYALLLALFPQFVARASAWTVLTLPVMASIYWAEGVQAVPQLDHTWSLAVEWQFYLVWPLLLMLLARLRVGRRWLAALMGLALLWMLGQRLHGNLYFGYDGIMMGALVAWAQRSARVRRAWQVRGWGSVWIWALLSLAVVVALWLLGTAHTVNDGLNKPVMSLCMALLLMVVLNNHGRWQLLLDNPVLRHFARISYGLYLYHFPLASLMFVAGFAPWQMLLAGVLLAWPLAELSWYLLEAPLLRGRWRWRWPLGMARQKGERVKGAGG